MGAVQIIALFCLPFIWWALAQGPSRSAMRGIRKRARKNGISEEQAYREYMLRKKPNATAGVAGVPQEKYGMSNFNEVFPEAPRVPMVMLSDRVSALIEPKTLKESALSFHDAFPTKSPNKQGILDLQITPAASNDEPRLSKDYLRTISVDRNYRGILYNLHEGYAVSAIVGGQNFRWRSVQSFQRWVDQQAAE